MEKGQGQPEHPGRLGLRGWREVVRRTVRRFWADDLMDRAAALTFYGMLSLFPTLVVVVSLVGMSGASGTRTLAGNVRRVAPGPVGNTLAGAIESLRGTAPTAGVFAVVSLAMALWSASNYIAAFIRAANSIYEVPEGRPIWKLAWLRLALTLVVVIVLTAGTLAVALSGRLVPRLGQVLGIGSVVVTAWNLLKWPVLALVIVLVVAVLYWAAPNVQQPGVRWITPGGALAVAVWALASAGFKVYVANVGSFNRIYGSLAGVVIFMVWLWLSNLAILLGAELDAELTRARRAGPEGPAERRPFMEPRDTRRINDREEPDGN